MAGAAQQRRGRMGVEGGGYGEGTNASQAREGRVLACLAKGRGLGLLGICSMGSKKPITDVHTE